MEQLSSVAQCTATHRTSYCTLPEGHSGPHGISIGGGLVIAPWDGGVGGGVQEPTNLFCEYCGGRFTLTRHGRGGTFDCSKCEQFHDFSDRYGPELYHTSGPTCRLFPEKMDRKLEMQFIKWRRKEFLLNQGMWLLLGQISQSEHDERVTQCEVDIAARIAELNEPQPTFWTRLNAWWKNGLSK